jgi:hypothetical protein
MAEERTGLEDSSEWTRFLGAILGVAVASIDTAAILGVAATPNGIGTVLVAAATFFTAFVIAVATVGGGIRRAAAIAVLLGVFLRGGVGGVLAASAASATILAILAAFTVLAATATRNVLGDVCGHDLGGLDHRTGTVLCRRLLDDELDLTNLAGLRRLHARLDDGRLRGRLAAMDGDVEHSFAHAAIG